MKKMTYKTSGVDVGKANVFVKAIGGHVASTLGVSVLRREGAFGGLFALEPKAYKQPVLVSSTDGVGTKLIVAQNIGRHDTVGIDLVAMNVNDILCVGAKPLFFLDYIACGKLNPSVLKDVVKGIAKGCKQSGCSLIGGETAEMPDMYKKDDYDLAGFAVGIVEKRRIIDGAGIKPGDKLVGFPSSGFHSNGYSLVRKVFSKREQSQYAKDILSPTKIYVKDVSAVLEKFKVKGVAHITGGAYYEKLTKVLPKGACFVIKKGSWPIPKIIRILQEKGRISETEMYKIFNMGIGLAIVIASKDLIPVKCFLKERKIRHYEMGDVVLDNRKKVIFA